VGRQGRVVCWCVLPVSQCLFPGLWFVSVVEVLLHVVESGFLPSVVVLCVCPLLHPVVTFPYEPYYAGSSLAHTLAFGRSLARDVTAGSVQAVRGYSSVLSCTACRRWCVLCGNPSSLHLGKDQPGCVAWSYGCGVACSARGRLHSGGICAVWRGYCCYAAWGAVAASSQQLHMPRCVGVVIGGIRLDSYTRRGVCVVQ